MTILSSLNIFFIFLLTIFTNYFLVSPFFYLFFFFVCFSFFAYFSFSSFTAFWYSCIALPMRVGNLEFMSSSVARLGERGIWLSFRTSRDDQILLRSLWNKLIWPSKSKKRQVLQEIHGKGFGWFQRRGLRRKWRRSIFHVVF